MEIKDNQLLNIKQAASLLGWSYQRFHYHCIKPMGNPPHTVQGGHMLFEPTPLLDWRDSIFGRRTSNG